MAQQDSEKRLAACPGVSVTIACGVHPPEALTGKGHLSIQTSGYEEVDLDEVLPLLHDIIKTFDLEFIGPVSDKDLRHLVGLWNILFLKLNRGQVTDAGLQHLAGLTSLRVLELSGLPVTTAGLKNLAGLTNLRELHLGWTQADDESVEALSGLCRLTKLDLSGCPVTDRCLEPLSRLTGLQTLSLSGTKIEGTGLASLDRLENLESLNLDLLALTDAQVSCFARVRRLRLLSLHGTQVGDQGAGWLAGLPGLCWLTLSDTHVNDDGVRHLRGCEGLINVRLDGTKVTGSGLAHLPKDLQVLSLTGVQLKEEDFVGIAHLRGLAALLLDERVANEEVVRRLKRMHLARCQAYDEGVAAFSRLPACPLCHEVIEEGGPVFVHQLSEGDSRFAIPVRVVQGFPVMLARLIDQYRDPVMWSLIIGQPKLGGLIQGLGFLLGKWDKFEAWPALPEAAKSGKEFLDRTLVIASALQQVALTNKVVQQIREIHEDILGLYRFQPGQSSSVELYWLPIAMVAAMLDVAIEDLTVVVLIHELAHGYTHMGRDIDGASWSDAGFGESELAVVEGLAQFYTEVVSERLAALRALANIAHLTSGGYLGTDAA